MTAPAATLRAALQTVYLAPLGSSAPKANRRSTTREIQW